MKSFLATAAMLVVLCANAVPAIASVEVSVGDKLNLYRGNGTLGGEFYVDILKPDTETTSPYDFGTFCVQLSEHIQVSSSGTKHTYEVLDISLSTLPGGSGSANLGSFAAWLYTMYCANPAMITSSALGNTMQAGIWLSMGYTLPTGFTGYGYATNATLQGWHAAYVSDVDNDLWGTDPGGTFNAATLNFGTFTGDVKIMSLGTRYTSGPHSGQVKTHNQDQLVKMPPPPGGNVPVPEPTSVAVWALLSICVGGLTSAYGRNRS
jgi:hypothetical protein